MNTSSKTASRKKKPVRRVPITVLDSAHVTLHVTRFLDVLNPEVPDKVVQDAKQGAPKIDTCTPHRMSMPKKHPQVSIDPDDPETLLIEPKGATLLFKITPDEYCPVGIAFSMGEKRKATMKGKHKPTMGEKRKATVYDLKRLHTLNFAQMKLRPDERTLQVTDHFKAIGRDARYKFSVIIMRVKDGAIGIIDPGVVNES